MTTQNLQQSMTADDRVKFERGCELLKYMQAGKAFDEYWVPIGDGLLAVRRTVMEALRLKKARGGYYNDAFGKMCAKTPYAEMHKVERSNMLYCMEHLPDVLEMRVGWTPTERANVNHPTSMAKRLREFLNRAPVDKVRRNASPMALLKDRNEQLSRANLDQAERIAALEADTNGGSLFDLKRDSADDIVQAIAGNIGVIVSLGKVEAIGKGLLDEVKRKRQQPAG